MLEKNIRLLAKYWIMKILLEDLETSSWNNFNNWKFAVIKLITILDLTLKTKSINKYWHHIKHFLWKSTVVFLHYADSNIYMFNWTKSSKHETREISLDTKSFVLLQLSSGHYTSQNI